MTKDEIHELNLSLRLQLSTAKGTISVLRAKLDEAVVHIELCRPNWRANQSRGDRNQPMKSKEAKATEDLATLLTRKCPCCGNIGHTIKGTTDLQCQNPACDVRTFRIRMT